MMDSLFFNISKTRYMVTDLGFNFKKVDISNGVLFLEYKSDKKEIFRVKNLDRMVMIVMVNSGKLDIVDQIAKNRNLIKESKISIFCSSRQDLNLEFDGGDIFVLFIADFFLKRYLSGDLSEPIDYLYQKIQGDISLEFVDSFNLDAVSLYIIKDLLNISKNRRMKSIKAMQLVIEYIIHIFLLLDTFDGMIDEVYLKLASRAKSILLKDFIDPPTIKELAHLCATNETKLKVVFKQVYHHTIHEYVQQLRLKEANLLLKDGKYSIGEIAKMVGYKHQSYFSKLFFQHFGIYPKKLIKKSL